MPSTYSSSLRLELQASGENANTWGNKTNNNLSLIEQAIAGYTKITLTSASATYNLTIADASASEGRNAFIEFAGTVASAISIVVPDAEKGYWVRNSATGSPLTFRTSSGTGLTLPTNEWVFLIADGTSVVSTLPTSLTNYARLAAAQTFTNTNTFTSAVTFQGPVSVVGATTFTSAATFSGAVSLASTLAVNSTATFSGVVSVSGTFYSKLIIGTSALFFDKLQVGGTLGVASNASVAGSLDVFSTFTVSGASYLASAVTISGPTSIANTLRVQSTATFDSNVSVSGSLGVFGAATFSSAVTIKTLSVTNVATFNSNVSVSGAFAVDGATTFRGAVSLASILTVNMTGTFNGRINVSSGATFGGTVSVGGELYVGAGDLDVYQTGSTTQVRVGSFSTSGTPTTPQIQIVKGNGNFSSVTDVLGPVGILSFAGNSIFAQVHVCAVALASVSAFAEGALNFSTRNKDTGLARALVVTERQTLWFIGKNDNPTGAVAGEVYYNTSANKLRCYNGTTWNDLF